jgi:hypothetical protein
VIDEGALSGPHETAAKRSGNSLLPGGRFSMPCMDAYGIETVACDVDEDGLPSSLVQEAISRAIVAAEARTAVAEARTAVAITSRRKPAKKPAKRRLLAHCDECGKTFHAARKDQRFCPGGTCKQRAYRAPITGAVTFRRSGEGDGTGQPGNREYAPVFPGAVEGRNVTPAPVGGAR